MTSYWVVAGILIVASGLGYASVTISSRRAGVPAHVRRVGERIWFAGCGLGLVAATAILATLNLLDG